MRRLGLWLVLVVGSAGTVHSAQPKNDTRFVSTPEIVETAQFCRSLTIEKPDPSETLAKGGWVDTTAENDGPGPHGQRAFSKNGIHVVPSNSPRSCIVMALTEEPGAKVSNAIAASLGLKSVDQMTAVPGTKIFVQVEQRDPDAEGRVIILALFIDSASVASKAGEK